MTLAQEDSYECPRCNQQVQPDDDFCPHCGELFLEKGHCSVHPVVFSRKASPISLGAPDYTLFRASGDFDGHIVNELKVMVPAQEFPEAEKKLKVLGLLQ